MGPIRAARLFALKGLWQVTGLESAGRALVNALKSPDQGVRTIAGMFLVQGGRKAEPLLAEAIRRGINLPMVLVMAGDIGAVRLEPELRRYAEDQDPEIARAARDGLRILAAQTASGAPGSRPAPG